MAELTLFIGATLNVSLMSHTPALKPSKPFFDVTGPVEFA